jgi:phosphohistidine phosphatase
MKRIFFLRHGSAAHMGENDFSRALTTKGKEEVNKIADYFHKSQFSIDLVISSSAIRAKETSDIFIQNAKSKTEILYESFIYDDYSTEDIIEYFYDIPDMLNNILFVGHNPNISRISMNLGKNLEISMSPAEIIGLEFEIEIWNQLESRSGEIIFSKRV